MDEQRLVRVCPDCGEQMVAGEMVGTGEHISCWWRCTNYHCNTSWLLPEPQMVLSRH